MTGDFVQNDLAAIFDPEALGSVATYAGRNINVMFYNEYEAASFFSVDIDAATPFALARDVDIAGILYGETFTVNSTAYKIRGIRPDGTGATMLVLSKD